MLKHHEPSARLLSLPFHVSVARHCQLLEEEKRGSTCNGFGGPPEAGAQNVDASLRKVRADETERGGSRVRVPVPDDGQHEPGMVQRLRLPPSCPRINARLGLHWLLRPCP